MIYIFWKIGYLAPEKRQIRCDALTYHGLMIFENFVGKMGFLGRGLGIRNIEKAKCGAFSLLTIFFLNIFLSTQCFFMELSFFLIRAMFFAVFFFLSIFFVCSGSRDLNRVSSILVVHVASSLLRNHRDLDILVQLRGIHSHVLGVACCLW